MSKRSKRNRYKPSKPVKATKPFDPAEAARLAYEQRRDPGKWGLNEEALRLAANSEVTDEAETRLKVRRVQRFDVFHLLHARGSLTDGQLAAVRRMQDDMSILHATSGQRRGTSGPADIAGFSAARCEAGKRLTDALDGDDGYGGIPARSKALLRALSEPEIVEGRRTNWRAEVQRITGEYRKIEQGKLVVLACKDLTGSYSALDNRPRQKAA